MDLTEYTAPKSNQLNADDLIAGPRVITITEIKHSGNAEQPVAVHFEGDNGKPFLPCKSMRRIMVAAWGKDGSIYVGRSMRLYRDPDVSYAGVKVGGIRISHVSHIEAALNIALTVNNKQRKPYKVLPLQDGTEPAQSAPVSSSQSIANLI